MTPSSRCCRCGVTNALSLVQSMPRKPRRPARLALGSSLGRAPDGLGLGLAKVKFTTRAAMIEAKLAGDRQLGAVDSERRPSLGRHVPVYLTGTRSSLTTIFPRRRFTRFFCLHPARSTICRPRTLMTHLGTVLQTLNPRWFLYWLSPGEVTGHAPQYPWQEYIPPRLQFGSILCLRSFSSPTCSGYSRLLDTTMQRLPKSHARTVADPVPGTSRKRRSDIKDENFPPLLAFA